MDSEIHKKHNCNAKPLLLTAPTNSGGDLGYLTGRSQPVEPRQQDS